MAKVQNKKTKVIKNIEKDFEASMYLATGEWELIENKKEEDKRKPVIETEDNKIK